MNVNTGWCFPPQNLSSCIGVICNGEIEKTSKERLNSMPRLFGVDGGINHADRLGLKINWIVGDFDSVDPNILEKYSAQETVHLPRAKEHTDLEEAIDQAKKLDAKAQIIIHGALGGRVDHTLGNIYYLLRDPLRLFLESEEQMVFAINDESGNVEIHSEGYKSLTLFPLYGSAEKVKYSSGNAASVETIDDSKLWSTSVTGNCHITVGKGELIVLLDKRPVSVTDVSKQLQESAVFPLEKPLFSLFDTLLSMRKQSSLAATSKENICMLSSNEKVSFPQTKIGQTISLIPFYGPAKGIITEGLKWELGGKLTELDKNFVGISNVGMQIGFSVSLGEGNLLCVITSIIDQDMVDTALPTKKK